MKYNVIREVNVFDSPDSTSLHPGYKYKIIISSRLAQERKMPEPTIQQQEKLLMDPLCLIHPTSLL